jgi:hypothetical protein
MPRLRRASSPLGRLAAPSTRPPQVGATQVRTSRSGRAVGQAPDQRILPTGKFGLEFKPRPNAPLVIRFEPDNLGQHVEQFMLVDPHTQHQHVTRSETVALQADRSPTGGGILHNRRDGGLAISGGLTSHAGAERDPVFAGLVTHSHRSGSRSGSRSGKRANLFPQYRRPGVRDFDRFVENAGATSRPTIPRSRPPSGRSGGRHRW